MRRIEQPGWPLRLRHVATAAEVVMLQRELRFADACGVLRHELAQARAQGNEAVEATDLNFLADAALGTGDADAVANHCARGAGARQRVASTDWYVPTS